jgi:O-antigen/teichoic acid export membrane protein
MTASASAGRRNIVTNAVVSWTGFVVQVGITFFLSPVLVHGLGLRRYGFWSVVESILTYLVLFDFGVGASVVRYVAKFEAARDRESLNGVFSTALCIFAAAGLLAFGLVVAIAFLGIGWLGVPPDLSEEVRWLLILLGLNLALGLPLGVFPCLLVGLGRFPARTAIRTGMLFVRTALLVVIVWQGGGLIGLAAAITACGAVEYLGTAAAAWWYLPGLRFSLSRVRWATFQTIRGYSIDAFLIMLASRISFQTDALVINGFLAPEFITFFVIAGRLVEYAKDSLRVVTTVLTPAVSTLEVQGDYAAIRQILLNSTRYVLWLILPIQAGLLTLGRPFIAVWMKDAELARQSSEILLILSLPLGLAIAHSVSTRILYGTSCLRWFARACMAEAAANLVLSIALVKPLAIAGVAWGTTIPNIVLNLGLAVYICRLLNVSGGEYLRRAILPPLAPACLLGLFWHMVGQFFEPTSWAALAQVGILGLAGYFSLALLAEYGPRRLGALLKPTPRAIAAGAESNGDVAC